MMKAYYAALVLLAAMSATSLAASVVNKDSESRTITVAEGGSRSDLTIGAGQSVNFCSDGCFVTMPNGDREALAGGETIEISGGVGQIR